MHHSSSNGGEEEAVNITWKESTIEDNDDDDDRHRHNNDIVMLLHCYYYYYNFFVMYIVYLKVFGCSSLVCAFFGDPYRLAVFCRALHKIVRLFYNKRSLDIFFCQVTW